MKLPKVGEIVYAGQWSQNRIGETEFLCSTQENVDFSVRLVLEEMNDSRVETDHEGDQIIVWEMRRVR